VNNLQLDQRLVDTVSRVLNLDASSITPDTSPRNTAAWDSVGHINLVLELEDVFGVRFQTDEIPMLDSVAKLQAAIARNGPTRVDA
jgi:acyl carrier protein